MIESSRQTCGRLPKLLQRLAACCELNLPLPCVPVSEIPLLRALSWIFDPKVVVKGSPYKRLGLRQVGNDSKCRKAILPTGEQLAVMEAEGLKNVKEEAELRMRRGV